MKLVKMSLAAAMLMGVSAYAVDNVKVAGDAKLFYSTADADDADLFDKTGSIAQTAASVGLTADLLEGVSTGVSVTGISTLGLEGQLVNGVWEPVNGVSDYFWFDEAWMASTMGGTTAKVGRMALDTPLVFSEEWSIAHNTFDAAVLLNQDIPDTTLVAAYVGSHNGGTVLAPGVLAPKDATTDTAFRQFYNGAYAFGVVNNSWKPLTVQGWYYDATRVIQAYWLQADMDLEGILVGLQYTGQEVQDATVPDADSQDAFAAMLGYKTDAFRVSGAYSQTGDKGPIKVGGNLAASGQSKLYTEAWWNYGYITQVDTSSFNLTATADLSGFGLGAYYTGTSNDTTDVDMNELTLEVTKSFGPLDTGLYYINTDADDQNDGDAYNTVQVYLTLNF